MPRVTAAGGVLVGAAAAVVALAGCTAGSGGASSSSTPATSASKSSSVPATSTASGGGSSTTPTAPGSTGGTGSTGSTPTTAPTAPDGSCAPGSLSLEVVPASGASGVQYAIVTFTNTGTASCTLSGFPGVSLLLGGQAVGNPATDTDTPVTTVTLAPQGSAQARVAAQSTCDAPLSDTLRVTLPGRSDFVDVAGQLRACQLTVDAVTGA